MATINLTADGNTEVGGINTGKEFSFAVSGDFGSGGTVKVQYRIDSGWVDYPEDGSFTAAGGKVYTQCGDEQKININLAGSTSPDLNIQITELRS